MHQNDPLPDSLDEKFRELENQFTITLVQHDKIVSSVKWNRMPSLQGVSVYEHKMSLMTTIQELIDGRDCAIYTDKAGHFALSTIPLSEYRIPEPVLVLAMPERSIEICI